MKGDKGVPKKYSKKFQKPDDLGHQNHQDLKHLTQEVEFSMGSLGQFIAALYSTSEGWETYVDSVFDLPPGVEYYCDNPACPCHIPYKGYGTMTRFGEEVSRSPALVSLEGVEIKGHFCTACWYAFSEVHGDSHAFCSNQSCHFHGMLSDSNQITYYKAPNLLQYSVGDEAKAPTYETCTMHRKTLMLPNGPIKYCDVCASAYAIKNGE